MSTALTLYNLEEQLVALLDTQEMVEDEQQQIAILEQIAEASQEAIAKRDGVVRMFRHLELQQTGIDAEIKRLQALKANYTHAEERLEKYVIRILDELVLAPKKGAKKLEGSIGVLSLKQNPPAVEITDERLVPTKFREVTVTMDAQDWLSIPDELTLRARKTEYRTKKADVKEALKAGEEVPGADLGFGSMRLEIR